MGSIYISVVDSMAIYWMYSESLVQFWHLLALHSRNVHACSESFIVVILNNAGINETIDSFLYSVVKLKPNSLWYAIYQLYVMHEHICEFSFLRKMFFFRNTE